MDIEDSRRTASWKAVSSPKYSDVELKPLLRAYARAAATHSKATLTGDHKEANRQYHELIAAYAEVRRRGSLRELGSVLSDNDPGVRLWTASHLLEIDPEKSEAVLKELAARQDLLGFTAATTLDHWRKEDLSFP